MCQSVSLWNGPGADAVVQGKSGQSPRTSVREPNHFHVSFLLLWLGPAAIAAGAASGCAQPSAASKRDDTMPKTQLADLTDYATFAARRRFVHTDFGDIAVVEHGSGPASVFLHGFPLNAFHWRHQLTALADTRRCIAIDLMGLGHTVVRLDQDLSFASQAEMVLATLDRLGVETFDLVGNDSGSGVAQLVTARAPARVRSLVLSNGDIHDNFPPKALNAVHDAAASGTLAEAFAGFLANPDVAVAQHAFATVFEHPAHFSRDLMAVYLEPVTASAERRQNLHRFVLSLDPSQTVAIRDELAKFTRPTLILWATSDPFFDVQWAHWLRETIPGTTHVVELAGAKLFFAEERPADVNAWLRKHWQDTARP